MDRGSFGVFINYGCANQTILFMQWLRNHEKYQNWFGAIVQSIFW